MAKIITETLINAPIQRCFDLSRSIDLHEISTDHTGEKAIAGKTSGLIEANEWVTWRARHFGIWQKLTSKITTFDPPYSFTDELVNGAFKSMKHQHLFAEKNGQTLMTDIMIFESPLGPLGWLANWLVLKRYMTNFLKKRNEHIKQFAESNAWQQVLPNPPSASPQ